MMNDKTDKLSALMDNELADAEKYCEQLMDDSELQGTWKRYHMVRDVMKGQLSDFPELDVSAAVNQSLKNEPVIFTPIWRRLSPRYVMKQAAGLAVAAAVGTLAVLSVQQTQIITSPDAQVIAAAIPQVQSGKIRQVSFTTREKLDSAVESKLSNYLVNHNEFSTTVRVSGVMPYTRIVSFVSTPSVASSK